MLSIRKKLFKNRKGFTLIELIVVIAILAILAVLAVPRFLDTLTNARQTTHEANVKTLRSAAIVSVAENGNPSATVTWTASTDGTGVDTDFDRDDYVEEWPTNPVDDTTEYRVQISDVGVITVDTIDIVVN